MVSNQLLQQSHDLLNIESNFIELLFVTQDGLSDNLKGKLFKRQQGMAQTVCVQVDA